MFDRIARLSIPLGKRAGFDFVFTDAGYVDAWQAAKNKGEELKSFRGDKDPTPGFRIDHILTKPAATVSAAGMSTFKDGNGAYPSDHLPVLARIRLP